MSKKKQITLEGMKKAMAIELLPAKELKKQAEVPVDWHYKIFCVNGKYGIQV